MSSQTIAFVERVDGALHDPLLQTALERATTRFTGNRARAVADVDNFEALRNQARAIRAGALARLDELLVRLAENVERHGGHVCWAEDGAAARQYIIDLARRRGVRTIVKSSRWRRKRSISMRRSNRGAGSH
jgi:Uncharacterized conserved protein containing a ferredoxin-like domain